MQNTLKIILSFSLFIILMMGVTGYYYQIYSKSNVASLSNFSEEDLHKEYFVKNILIEESPSESFLVGLPENIVLPHPPFCILEGHTGLVTPPPWL